MASEKDHGLRDGLSKREMEILRLLAEGLSDREIAERLMMTLNTIKWYNRQIYSILGVGSRTQAIARAHELQLLSEHDSDDRSANAGERILRHSLPAETTRFIGRQRELDTIKRLLDATHLLTLVGPPGTGKTRLARRAAWEVAEKFRDGVHFIPLAPLSDPALVLKSIASALGVNETPTQPLGETVKHALRERDLLLILDNFEHLLAAAPQISGLLTAAPSLKVLATSREPLHLYGEQEYAVPPLELPPSEMLDLSAVTGCESTALFIQQARAVRADFEVTSENALDIAQICVRLEGLPLAIELAAARIKSHTPRALLTRLNNRLDTLIGGAHDLPARQRTLRNTIEWSYNLLDEGEKMLFARLAVFQGGCSLEALEAVCGDSLPIDVFDGLDSLVNKSLVQHKETPDGESRFSMLETLHEYAWERLRASDEADRMRNRYAKYFAQLAERAEPELRQDRFSYWMGRLESEANNLHAALEWTLENGDLKLGLRLVAALHDFWSMSGRVVEGTHWVTRALAKSQSAPPGLRVRVLTATGIVLFYSAQHELQKQVLGDAIALARALDDRLHLAWALTFWGSASIGQASGIDEAIRVTEEGLSIFRTLGHKPGIAQALNVIGELARTGGDDERARLVYEECLRVVRETGELRRETMLLTNLGFIAMHRGEVEHAQSLYRDSLIKQVELGHDKHLIVSYVLMLASTIASKGDVERAVRLIGAADAWLDRMGVGLQPGNRMEHERNLTVIRTQLAPATFDLLWHEGRIMTLEQMVTDALEATDE